jgi:hypothetical protein
MTVRHDDVLVTAGDDWVINGTLFDSTGAVLDLNDAELMWDLRGLDGAILTLPSLDLQIADPNKGLVTLSISRADTAGLDPGCYVDALSIVKGNVVSTVWAGNIMVSADPYASP